MRVIIITPYAPLTASTTGDHAFANALLPDAIGYSDVEKRARYSCEEVRPIY